MDDRSFDQLTRALGGASTRRGAIAALSALLAGGAALDADARRRRGKERDDAPKAAGKRRNKKRCKPECTGNFSCVKGACVCESAMCGTACCDSGQVCQRGRCVGQGTVICHDLAEACGDGTPCCDGLQCGSGYGGGPVACYPVPGGECVADEECAYGQHCANGACVTDPPPPPPCTPTTCAAVGASCGAIPDGCGATLECGTCSGSATCQGGACVASCTPTFAVTADASANGLALQQAVTNAQSGDTIVLAGGDYQFDTQMVVAGLTVDKALTIKRCTADAVVNLVCPASINFSCVRADGQNASLSLQGITVKSISPTAANFYALVANNCTVNLEDVTLEVASRGAGPVLSQSTSAAASVAIKSGVALKTTDASPSFAALITFGSLGTISCTAEPGYAGYVPNLQCNDANGGAITGCGCP